MKSGSVSEQAQVEIEDLAREIKAYLDNHDRAVDTVDGVLLWITQESQDRARWLREQPYEEAKRKVQDALDRLSRKGLVFERRKRNGKHLYKHPTGA